MILADHLLLAVLAVVHPLAGYLSFRRLLQRIRAGDRIDRSRLYDATIISHWTLLGITLALWAGAGRDWATLGLGLEIDGEFLAALVLAALGIALLLQQLRQVMTASADELTAVRGALGNIEFIIPQNGSELGRFYLLSLTAGIVEEILWRGYMIWYFDHFMPLWAAALISTVSFALAHAYQGAGNLPKILLVGAAFAGLYLMTGSVWVAVVLHAAVDVLQGRTAYEIVRRAAPAKAAAPSDTGETADPAGGAHR
jgi:membrane protease YdiL (CAAX protease family)